MPRFAIVVAADEADGIGKDGTLPWRLGGDLAQFRQVTTVTSAPGLMNAVIMGRRTWDSLPDRFRPLPDRLNVVLTRNRSLALPEGVHGAGTLDEALDALHATPGIGQLFVIGGGAIYREALAHRDLDAVYLTRVHATFECDTRFAGVPERLTRRSQSALQREGDLTYHFEVHR